MFSPESSLHACHPYGDATLFAGSSTSSNPSVGTTLVTGSTLYAACATKSVIERSSPLCASTMASYQVFLASFWIWTTWTRAMVPSDFTRYSTLVWLLNFPSSFDSTSGRKEAMSTDGVEGAILSIAVQVWNNHGQK